jgi:hypothetical protein
MLNKVVNFSLVHAAIVVPLLVLAALVVSSTARAGAKMLARILARLLLIAAVIALAYDATRAFSGGSGPLMGSLLQHWQALSPATLEAARHAVSARLDPVTWQMAVVPLLSLPAWLTAGLLGLVLGWLGRRRREVSIFVN